MKSKIVLDTVESNTLTIDRELGWAAAIGMNCMRNYLHHVAWEVDKEGFKARMDKYLQIADKHGIKTIFVFFDDCWNPTYQAVDKTNPKGRVLMLDEVQWKDGWPFIQDNTPSSVWVKPAF